MPEEVLGASFRVYIGVKGDKIIKKYQHRIPRKSEGYFLKIEKDCIVIAGADERERTMVYRLLRSCLL